MGKDKKLPYQRQNEKLLKKFCSVFDGTKAYVYRIECLINSKRYYGETKNPQDRWRRHKNDAANDIHAYAIHHAIQKHGIQNFKFEVVEVCDTKAKAFEREKYWIAKDKTNLARYHDKARGYNLTDGGEGGELSQQARQKISEALTGRPLSADHIEKLRQAKLGKKHTQEHRDNMGIGQREKKVKARTRAKLSVAKTGEKHPYASLTEKDVIEIRTTDWQGLFYKDIAKIYGVSSTTIRDVLSGRSWTHLLDPSYVYVGRRGKTIKRRRKGRRPSKSALKFHSINQNQVEQIKKLCQTTTMTNTDIARQYKTNRRAVRLIRQTLT